MNYQIRRRLLDHEGGTKFYQLFLIVNPHTGKSALVTHYGPNSSRTTRPIEKGQMKVHEGDGVSAFNEVHAAKRKRGYRDALAGMSVDDMADTQDFGELVVQTFGAKVASEVFVKIGMTSSGRSIEDEAKPSPTPKVDHSTIDTEDLPADWGSW